MENTRAFIAVNIEFYRKKAGLTQVQAAKAAGVSLRSLQRAEDMFGQGNIEVGTLIAIGQALNVHPSKLMLPPGERIPVSPEEAWEIVGKALQSRRESPTPVSDNPDLARVAAALETEAGRMLIMDVVREVEKSQKKASKRSSESA